MRYLQPFLKKDCTNGMLAIYSIRRTGLELPLIGIGKYFRAQPISTASFLVN